MNNLLTLVLTAALTACGDGCIDAPTLPANVVSVVVEPAPVVTTPAPVVLCTTEITTNCEILFCPLSIGCAPSPTPSPNPPIITTPSPLPTCVRNADQLVLIDGVLTDNCGNKYGATTF
jgi:hypothetical protein